MDWFAKESMFDKQSYKGTFLNDSGMCSSFNWSNITRKNKKSLCSYRKKPNSMLVFTLMANSKPELDDRRCLGFLTWELVYKWHLSICGQVSTGAGHWSTRRHHGRISVRLAAQISIRSSHRIEVSVRQIDLTGDILLPDTSDWSQLKWSYCRITAVLSQIQQLCT